MKKFNEIREGYVSHAQRKAVHAAKADGGKGHPDNKKEDADSDAVKAFLAKGGKIKKLPPGKAQGWHGKADPGNRVKGMLDKPDSSKMKNRGKHLDTSTPVHKEGTEEDIKAKIARHQKAHDHHQQMGKEADNKGDAEKHAKSQQTHAMALKNARDRLAKMQNEAYNEPQGQAKRLMSPLQKIRQDKEKADRDKDGKLKKEASCDSSKKVRKEVLDTPKAYNSYMRKSKTSANRAHTALTLGRRNPKDIKQANKTIQKRDKGHDMAKRVKDRQWNKAVKKGYVNDSLGESFDHSIHQDHAFAHYSAAMEHEDHGNHEAAAHHHKASNHHDEAHAAHEKGDHSVGAHHATKALHHASKAVRYSMKSGGEHQDISRHAYNDSKDTHDATTQSSGHSAVSVSKLTRRESVNEVLDTTKARNSYYDKAKSSKDKATNSAAANMLRKTDPSADLKTRAKREKGIKQVTNKSIKAFRQEKHDPKHVKQAVGIASDPRYKGGNMTGATKVINKLSKGLSDHPQVKAVLRRQNEETSINEEMSFRVDIEGLPSMFMYADGPGALKADLRKIIKQPSMIKSVKRVTAAVVKRTFRLKAQGRDDDGDGEIDSRQEKDDG